MSDIVIANNTYTSVPSIIVPKSGGGNAQFFDLDMDMAWLGKNVELLNGSFYSKSDVLKNTGFNGWTPSTTALSIVTSVTAGTFSANTANYEYYLVWECGVDLVYTGTPTQKALPLLSRCWMLQNITKRPSTWALIQSNSFNGNASTNVYTSTFLRYYGTTTGTVTYTWSASNGFYFGATAATFSNATTDTPTVTVKTPTLSAKCSTTYMSTANAGLIDQEKSTWFIRGKIYRVTPNSIEHNILAKVVSLINA